MGFWSGFFIGIVVGAVGIIVIALTIAKDGVDYKPSNCTKDDVEEEDDDIIEDF